jgi:hypothetical protein
MFELTNGLEMLPVAESIVTDEIAQLGRRSRRRGGHGHRGGSVCLISLNHVLEDVNILNLFGGF